MAKFTNTSGHALDVFAPSSKSDTLESVQVGPGETLDVPGDAVTQYTKDADGNDTDQAEAYTVGEGAKARLYPAAIWTLEGAEPAKKQPKKPQDNGGNDTPPVNSGQE